MLRRLLRSKKRQPSRGLSTVFGSASFTNTDYIVYGVRCPPQLHCDLTLADFRVLRAIGNGYSAIIFEAEHIPSGLRCVLKICMKTRLNAEEIVRMKREIQIHATIQHKHILDLYAAFQDSHAYYMVLEYASNGDLLNYLLREPNGRIEIPKFIKMVLSPLLQALFYLHKMNIIHRDIKPENILVDKKGRIRLCDFGMAIDIAHERALSTLGTLEYMAPELVNPPPRGSGTLEYTEKVDVWALGVLSFECIVGKSPFTASHDRDIMENIIHCSYNPLAVPNGMARDFIDCCLQLNPDRRSSIAQLLKHPFVTSV